MAFNPDKFLNETTPTERTPAQGPTGGFDPDKFLSEIEPESRKGEAALQAFGNQAAMGYLPQLQAAAEGVTDPIFNAFKSDEEKKIDQEFNVQEESYTDRRDRNINRAKSLEDQHPAVSTAASVAGGIVGTAALGAGMGSAASKLATRFPSKFASAFSKLESLQQAKSVKDKLALAASAGAATGAIRNPGDTEGEVSPLQLEDRAKNLATDATIGVAFQGGMSGLGKVGSRIKGATQELSNYASDKALKSSGAMLKDFRKAFGNNKVKELGQSAIDEGIVSIGDDIADIAKKAEVVKGEIGDKISAIYSSADDVLNKTQAPGLDFEVIANDFGKDLSKKYAGKAGSGSIVNKVNDVLEEIKSNKNVGLKQAQEIRGSIDELINYSKANNEMSAIQTELRGLRNNIQDKIKERLGDIDKLNKTNLVDDFLRENKRYSNVAELSKMAKDKVARETSNASFGMRERLSTVSGTAAGAGIGAMLAGPIGAAAGGYAGGKLAAISTKAARQYGTPFVAISANKVARALERNPKLLGRFSNTLIEASEVSPAKFVAQVNSLLSEPDFKRQLNNLKPAASNDEDSKSKSGVRMALR